MSEGEPPRSAAERREALKRVYAEAQSCTRCPELASTRSSVVFGAGNADADLMFVGEAPGAKEDEQGVPFVGQAGKLLEKLLGEIGMQRSEVFIANTLKCLSYNAQVQLADGSWERIGRLVRRRYQGKVMAVDAGGGLVARSVIGWHESPVGDRRVFQLTHAAAKRAGAGRACVEITGDHPVLTERGYVPVEDLSVSDRIATGQASSDLAYDVVCGTLLGDGSLQARSATLTLAHSDRQESHAAFEAQLLAALKPRLAKLATSSFAADDLQVLICGLARLGLPAKASRGRLCLDVATTESLCEKIAPHASPSMRYKLHPEVEAGVPFDESGLRPRAAKVMFDSVEVADVTSGERADRTFFCLDVEETHNFVTAGGVVHNCRPPGNRDPLPLELENCRDYLYSQLELIRPKVVCTLGNFATKLLREDKTGITRLHGQPELRAIGPRVVRLYPIFHPAAALYTPRMLHTLREDFMRLPELLAMPEPEQPEQPEQVPEPEPERRRQERQRAQPSHLQGAGAGAAGRAAGAGSQPGDAASSPQEASAPPDQLGLF